jgi:acylphosphatase
MKTVQLIIKGRVQGVYFRAFTQKQAVKRGVTGFVSNNTDGSVIVVACAEDDKLTPFIAWCHKGPLLAKVKEVVVNEDILTDNFTQFEIR